MTATVGVRAEDRAVIVRRVEAGGDEVTISPGSHFTFTIRPHEQLLILGDLAEPAAGEAAKPPSQVG